jgi:hypothetical protein
VLRVYLDQNQWVNLLRADGGNKEGAGFVDALAMCRAASTSGRASFPLDMYRYFETAKRNADRSRHGLADLMWELSRRHTMSLPFPLLDRELDVALARRFGRPVPPHPPPVFGVGMPHIAADRMAIEAPDLSVRRGAGKNLTPGQRAALEAEISEAAEHGLLSAGPDDHARAGGVALDELDFGRRYVEQEEAVAKFISDNRLRGADVNAYVRSTELVDNRDALVRALERAGLTLDDFVSTLGERGMLAFVEDLPTRWVASELRAAKHKMLQEPWEENDFVDMVALPVAAVYCDVVVTEKRWAHRMRAAGVEKRFGTKVLSSLKDLTHVLAASAS